MTELVRAALYGLAEGIGEWLPISSVGHILLLDNFYTLRVTLSFWRLFLAAIQLGATIALCQLLAHRLGRRARRQGKTGRGIPWAVVAIASLPSIVTSILVDSWAKDGIGSPLLIAVVLIVYGVGLVMAETLRERQAATRERRRTERGEKAPDAGRHMATPTLSVAERADRHARIRRLANVNLGTALLVGTFQALVPVPGTARSGPGVTAALLLGCTRTVAIELASVLAIPVMLESAVMHIARYFLAGNALTPGSVALLVVGVATAYVASLVAVRLLMSYVRRHDLKPFGWYRIALGIVIIMCVIAVW